MNFSQFCPLILRKMNSARIVYLILIYFEKRVHNYKVLNYFHLAFDIILQPLLPIYDPSISNSVYSNADD